MKTLRTSKIHLNQYCIYILIMIYINSFRFYPVCRFAISIDIVFIIIIKSLLFHIRFNIIALFRFVISPAIVVFIITINVIIIDIFNSVVITTIVVAVKPAPLFIRHDQILIHKGIS